MLQISASKMITSVTIKN